MKCSNCGKNFDYEKYYGICPKCGSFMVEKGSNLVCAGDGCGYREAREQAEQV